LEASALGFYSQAETFLKVCGFLWRCDDMATSFALVASLYGMVTASFAIEQNGLPRLSQVEGQPETWNGADPRERLCDLTRWTEEEGGYYEEDY
jgi:hypothetical protein